jgi:hypothetical protein
MHGRTIPAAGFSPMELRRRKSMRPRSNHFSNRVSCRIAVSPTRILSSAPCTGSGCPHVASNRTRDYPDLGSGLTHGLWPGITEGSACKSVSTDVSECFGMTTANNPATGLNAYAPYACPMCLQYWRDSGRLVPGPVGDPNAVTQQEIDDLALQCPPEIYVGAPSNLCFTCPGWYGTEPNTGPPLSHVAELLFIFEVSIFALEIFRLSWTMGLQCAALRRVTNAKRS